MNGTLDGKVALVTGGSRGIGRAVVLRLAQDGADVALTYHTDADAAADVVAQVKALGRRAWAVQLDGADAHAVAAAVRGAVAGFGRIDILVNNAGVGIVAPLDELSLADVDRVLDVNVRAPFLAAQAAARQMTEGGRIISIGSCMTERSAFGGGSLYATSKAALTGLTRSLARELGPRGITANLVQPGPTGTGMNPEDGPGADLQRGFTALGRFGQPEDVAAGVAFLAGDEARQVTGACLAVDGGFAA